MQLSRKLSSLRMALFLAGLVWVGGCSEAEVTPLRARPVESPASLLPAATTAPMTTRFTAYAPATAPADLAAKTVTVTPSDRPPDPKTPGPITQAVAAAEPGTVIEVRGGVYRGERIVFKTSGTPEKPIVLRAAPGEKVVIKGSETINGWTQDPVQPTVYHHADWPYYFGKFDPAKLEIIQKQESQGIESWDNEAVDARFRARNQLFVDGLDMAEVSTPEHLLPGTFYMDAEAKRVSLRLVDGSDPARHEVEMSNTAGPLLSTRGQSHIVLQGLQFAHCSNGPQHLAMVTITEGTQVRMEDCRVEYAAGSGLSFNGKNCVLRRSVFNHNGQLGIHSSKAEDCVVEDCETSYNNRLSGRYYDRGWEAGGNKFSRSRRLKVVHLISHHNWGPGIWFDGDNQDALIDRCVTFENMIGIHYEISYTALICNNLVYSNHYQSKYTNAPIGMGIFISSSAGCRVYNNTVFGNDNGGIMLGGAIRNDGANRKVVCHSNRIFNNIIADSHLANRNGKSFNLALGKDKNATEMPELSNSLLPVTKNVSDYNLYFLSKPGPFFFGPGTSRPGSLEEWQSISGQDLHSVWADPRFANPAGGDFRLLPDSPAIDRGAALSDVPHDAGNIARPLGKSWDIGALECR